VIRACCPQCRLRFTQAAAVSLAACPACRRPLEEASTLQDLLGFRLTGPVRSAYAPPESAAAAASVSIPVPDRSSR